MESVATHPIIDAAFTTRLIEWDKWMKQTRIPRDKYGGKTRRLREALLAKERIPILPMAVMLHAFSVVNRCRWGVVTINFVQGKIIDVPIDFATEDLAYRVLKLTDTDLKYTGKIRFRVDKGFNIVGDAEWVVHKYHADKEYIYARTLEYDVLKIFQGIL